MYHTADFRGARPVTSYNFTRTRYDACETTDSLERSTGPGRYAFAAADMNCGSCYQPNPKVRLQKTGDSEIAHYGRTDVESELLNLTRSASHCAAKEYQPATNPFNRDSLLRMPDCTGLRLGEDTRLNNPACNIRGAGINRFEWPCIDPQKNVEMPFDWGVQARTLAKDNHRPCVPRPIDVSPSLPQPPFPLPRPEAVPAPMLVAVPAAPQPVACMGTPGNFGPAPIGPPLVQYAPRRNLAAL